MSSDAPFESDEDFYRRLIRFAVIETHAFTHQQMLEILTCHERVSKDERSRICYNSCISMGWTPQEAYWISYVEETVELNRHAVYKRLKQPMGLLDSTVHNHGSSSPEGSHTQVLPHTTFVNDVAAATPETWAQQGTTQQQLMVNSQSQHRLEHRGPVPGNPEQRTDSSTLPLHRVAEGDRIARGPKTLTFRPIAPRPPEPEQLPTGEPDHDELMKRIGKEGAHTYQVALTHFSRFNGRSICGSTNSSLSEHHAV
ncbi:hypothetical protein CERSUDRAFT_101130 [Gelatoporia subvermispora B]|uniref:Uncharacterized protein n=1 Tax=Ceriporiopsis subvermispora (strain B) TaxID=914234 RepID=M2Q1G4_CERS8|nr:hypothetical protein CERSUDRAFT_101130 [Gelatoporia subvermispora B]